jgi:hypothetical protein
MAKRKKTRRVELKSREDEKMERNFTVAAVIIVIAIVFLSAAATYFIGVEP